MTLAEISKLAEVSITTVHRVFSGKGDVNSDTARRILEIAKQNGYEPPSTKKHRKQEKQQINLNVKTGNIGLLLSGLPYEALRLPLNMQVISLFETALSQYDLFLSIVQDSENKKLSEILFSKRFDGLIVMGDIPQDSRELLTDIPCVGIFGSNYYDTPRIDWVLPDYQSRARLAVDYFFSLGLEEIAYLNPVRQHPGFEEIGLEFVRYARQKKLKASVLTPELPLESKIYRQGIEKSVIKEVFSEKKYFASNDKPKGLFVANDAIAIDVYTEMYLHNINPGKDVYILSSDNIDVFLDRLTPRPPSIDLNYSQIVELAVDRLLKRIEQPFLEPGVRIMIQPKLELPKDSNH